MIQKQIRPPQPVEWQTLWWKDLENIQEKVSDASDEKDSLRSEEGYTHAIVMAFLC